MFFVQEVDIIVESATFGRSISAQRGVISKPVVPQITEIGNNLLLSQCAHGVVCCSNYIVPRPAVSVASEDDRMILR